MKNHIITMLCISTSFAPQACALSSIRGITAVIRNETPQEFIITLVYLESSQEISPEVLNAKGAGRDVIGRYVPPGRYAISIFHQPTRKKTNISNGALRRNLSPGGSCVQLTLRSSIYVGEPQIEYGACPSNLTGGYQ